MSASSNLTLERAKRASKMRRDQELEELYELEKLLPMPLNDTKVDKAAIVRLTTACITLKQHLADVKKGNSDDSPINDSDHSINGMCDELSYLGLDEQDLLLGALDGCIIMLDDTGKVLYVSNNSEDYIGIKQAEMIGQSISTFIHSDDRKELLRQFSQNPPPLLLRSVADSKPLPVCGESISADCFVGERGPFYIRMRYSFQKPGSKCRQSGFMLTQWSGRLQLGPHKTKPRKGKHDKAKDKKPESEPKRRGLCVRGLVALVRPMQILSVTEIRLDGNMFITHHNMALDYVFCDNRILTLIGYEPNELVGRTAYLFHNPLDAAKCQACHNNLLAQGSQVSKHYRFLGKTGEWVWMQTRATIISNASNEPQYIVCMNYVIGQNEGRRHLMMEQEEAGIMQTEQGEARGAIDVTCLSSPGSKATSSGYCSAEEDHSYSTTSRSQDISLSASPVSGSVNNSLPPTPSAVPSPDDVFNMDVVGSMPQQSDTKNKSEFSTEDINLDDLIEDWLESAPPDTTNALVCSEASAVTSTAGIDSSQNLQQWPTASLPTSDVDMMDIDPVLGVSTSNITTLSTSDTNILIGLLKEAERKQQVSLASDAQTTPGTTQIETNCSLSSAVPTSLPTVSPVDCFIPSSLPQPISICSFPNEMMDSDGNMLESVDDFAGKFGDTFMGDSLHIPDTDNLGLGNDYLQMAGLNADNLLSGMSADLSSAADTAGFASDCLMSTGLSTFLQDGQTPPLTGNPFMLGECSAEKFEAASQPETVMISSAVTTSAEPVQLSTPTTMYIPTPSGMRSVTVPQTALNKNPPISILPASVRKVTLPSQVSSSSSSSVTTASQSRTIKTTSNQPNKVQQQQPQQQRVKQQQQQQQPQKTQLSPTPQSKPVHNTSFLDDHRYTSKQPHEQPKVSSSRRTSSSSSSKSSSSRSTPAGSALEHFLTTKQRVDPQKGSDAALAARGLSQLILHDHHTHRTNGSCSVDEEMDEEGTAPLLKKLLTGEMDHGEVRRHEQQLIENRRGVMSTDSLSDSLSLNDSLCLEESDQCIELNLLGTEPGSQIDKIWTPTSPRHDLMSSELDEILHEQMRQEKLWLQHYFDPAL